jgi:hypothetical protein
MLEKLGEMQEKIKSTAFEIQLQCLIEQQTAFTAHGLIAHKAEHW